jgi:hypothetical protein
MKKNNVELIREMLAAQKPPDKIKPSQIIHWQHGYLIGLLSCLMDETYIVKQIVKARIKNEN